MTQVHAPATPAARGGGRRVGPVRRDVARFRLVAVAGAGIWLVYVMPAAVVAAREGTWSGWAGLAATIGLAVGYIACFWIWRGTLDGPLPERETGGVAWVRRHPGRVALLAVLAALAVVMVLTIGAEGLAGVIYLAIGGCVLLPGRPALTLAVLLAVGAEAAARLVPAWHASDGVGLSVLLSCLAVFGFRKLFEANVALRAAREQVRELAIAEERARVARDLHDLLGHSLTVVTVKAQLADRLVDADPAAARREIADIERLTRDALSDMRSTVAGYREPSLGAELAQARSALAVANIEARLPVAIDEVPADLRPLFAWAVLEGVTNVVRHSGARTCTVTVAGRTLCVEDDGRGTSAGDTVLGTGLRGLAERAERAGARLVVEAPPGGGCRLAVVGGPPREATP